MLASPAKNTAPAASAAPAAETAAPVGLSSADASPAADTTQIIPLDTVAAGVVVAGDEPVEQVEQQLDTQSAPAASQAFWALAPVERDVVDESGAAIFTIGPTAWALVIEDRGDSFVVRHEDGRIGYLNDVSGVTRG